MEHYLYAAYPFADEARLVLSNSTMHQVTIEGKLYSSSGRVAILDDVVLPPHQQSLIDLSQKIANEGPEFKAGGLELEFESVDPGIAGQLILRDPRIQQPIDIPLRSRANFRSSKLEALWWLPARDAQLGLMVFNTSATQTSGSVTITKSDGTVVRSIPVVLGPHNSVELDLQELQGHAVGKPGGISIQHGGAPGSLIASGYLHAPSAQSSTSLSLVDPETLYGSNIYGAGVQLGRTPLADERFSGQLIVRNLSGQSIPVTPTLQCGETRTALSDFVLQAGQSRRIEVPANAITCESGAVGVEVASPVKGSLLGRWLSVGKSSGLVVETAMHSVSPRANLSGSDPWWIDAETASILYVQNVGNQEAGVVPVIHYTQHGEHGGPMAHSDERYVVGLKRVRPGETVAIDIRALRDNQTPDVEGRVLPSDLRFGQIHWLRRHGPALVANVLTVSEAKRTASTFSFFCCYCSPRSVELNLQPANVTALVGEVHDETLWEVLWDCHNKPTSYPVPATYADWDSSNYAVATVNTSGRVFCGPSAGSATITAGKSIIWYEPDYSIGQGDSCYLDDYCYGEPVCQSYEAYVYAAAYFDVSIPPPPPPPPTATVDSANACADEIRTQLGPAGLSGSFKLEYVTSGGTARTLVGPLNRSSGTYTDSFGLPNLVSGDQLRTIRASWTVGGTTAVGTRSYAIDVLGDYLITCYNTPRESDATGTLVNAGTADANSNPCQWSPRNFIDTFLDRVNLNGSGIDSTGDEIQLEKFCTNPPPTCPAYCGRITPFNCERYRKPGSITTSCQNRPVAGDTVARRPGHTQLTCGNRIVVQGNGCRTVQDEGGGLTPTQIDMYQGVGAAVCAGWTNPTRKVIAIR